MVALNCVPPLFADTREEASITELHAQATAAYENGAFRESLHTWERALHAAESQGRGRSQVSILVNMAQAHQCLGNPALAFKRLEMAETWAADLDDQLVSEIQGVRATLGITGRERKKPKRSTTDSGSTEQARDEAVTDLDDLLDQFKPPTFPLLTQGDWSELMRYLRDVSNLRTSSNVRNLSSRLLDDRIEAAHNLVMASGLNSSAESKLIDSLPRTIKMLDANRPIEATLRIPDVAVHNALRIKLAEVFREASDTGLDLEIDSDNAAAEKNLNVAKRVAIELWDNVNDLIQDSDIPPELKRLAKIYSDLEEPLSALKKTKDRDIEEIAQEALTKEFRDPKDQKRLGSRSRNAAAWAATMNSSDAEWQTKEGRHFMQLLAKGYLPTLIELAQSHLLRLSEKSEIPHIEGCLEALERADILAEALMDPKIGLEIKRVRGAVMALIGHGRKSSLEEQLLKAWATARQRNDSVREASVLNDLGIRLAARSQDTIASLCFSQSAALAEASDQAMLAARAILNGARTSSDLSDLQGAARKIQALPSGHAKAMMLLSLGSIHAGRHSDRQAYQAYSSALRIAAEINDDSLRSYGQGLLGKLYLSQKRYAEAQKLTRGALQIAQSKKVRAADLMFRWTWQTGQIQRAQKQWAKAIHSYERAEHTLSTIRQDMVIGLGLRGPKANFRADLGPFYQELAGLYFTQAESVREDGDWKNLASKARSTMERFKGALLEDYFQDPGISTYRSSQEMVPKIPVDEVVQRAGHTALVYVIPMPDHTEILVDVVGDPGDHEFLWHTSEEINQEGIAALASSLRLQLDPLAGASDTSKAYLKPAQALYRHLIQPFEATFEKYQVNTLIMVPDGKLRSIPMAVLHDKASDTFLIQKYALAVVPDLSLMADHPKLGWWNRDSAGKSLKRPLLVGLSESVQGFSELPGVQSEVDQLVKEFKGNPTILFNKSFTSENFRKSFPRRDFDLVHIASHANFSTDLDNTFILSFDDKIGPAMLEKNVRHLAFRERPVDLLVLSACETAVGDDRASLGLGGIAVKSGAHSVLASLWAVDDHATQELIQSFYRNFLAESSKPLSKSQALQNAQIELLDTWEHPKYWAPFTVIGNWLAPEDRKEIFRAIADDKH